MSRRFSTTVIPDKFTGTHTIPMDMKTGLVPTGYTPEELQKYEQITYIPTGIDFERGNDADGPTLAMELHFETPIHGFSYRDLRYELDIAATGLIIACRANNSVTAVDANGDREELDARESIVPDSLGVYRVLPWKDLICEGAGLLATRAYIRAPYPGSTTQTLH